MEKLTIQEKAQRYDEAIERANSLLSGNQLGDAWIYKLLPELKETWNEKVRKWIIEMVEEVRKANPTNAEHNGMCSEAIFWLEKQGEQKPTDKCEGCNNAKGCVACVDGSEWAHVEEQNPAWSEEDEEEIEIAVEYLQKAGQYDSADWLKSLKERVQPKQKQELNEDTQQWIDAITKDYEEWYKVNKDHRATIQIKINILKSLKERYTWKPSDEQMDNK